MALNSSSDSPPGTDKKPSKDAEKEMDDQKKNKKDKSAKPDKQKNKDKGSKKDKEKETKKGRDTKEGEKSKKKRQDDEDSADAVFHDIERSDNDDDDDEEPNTETAPSHGASKKPAAKGQRAPRKTKDNKKESKGRKTDRKGKKKSDGDAEDSEMESFTASIKCMSLKEVASMAEGSTYQDQEIEDIEGSMILLSFALGVCLSLNQAA